MLLLIGRRLGSAGGFGEIERERRVRVAREHLLEHRDSSRNIEAEDARDQRAAGDAMPRREIWDSRREQPDPVDHREPDRVQEHETLRGALSRPGGFERERVLVQATEHPTHRLGEAKLLERLGDRDQRRRAARPPRSRRPVEPGSGIKGRDLAAQDLERAAPPCRLCHRHGPAEAG